MCEQVVHDVLAVIALFLVILIAGEDFKFIPTAEHSKFIKVIYTIKIFHIYTFSNVLKIDWL